MALTNTLGATLTTSTNPDPNTLSTVAPYTLANAYKFPPTIATAWTTQDKPGLMPLGSRDGSGDINIKLHFVPSTAGADFTIKVWMFNPALQKWGIPSDNGSVSYTSVGTNGVIDYINATGEDMIFLEIDALATATSLTIYYDPSNAEAK